MRKRMKPFNKPMKVATTQAYTELGFSIRNIAEMLRVAKDTVMRYQDQQLEDEWVQFKDTIKKSISNKTLSWLN